MRLRRLVSLAAPASVVLSLGTATSSAATPAPNDRPLPPYTIENPPLPPPASGGELTAPHGHPDFRAVIGACDRYVGIFMAIQFLGLYA